MDSAPTFDVLSQPLPILLRDGKTHANLTLSAIEAYAWNRSNTALVYGIELGLTIYALLIAYMCTRPEKRKSPIFILNILALIFNTIKAGFAAHYINGPFLELYAILASDFSRVPKGEYVCSVILVVCKFLALLCTEGSLVVQVHAVLATTTARQRLWLLMATGFFALAAVGCGFALTIFSAIAIMHTTVTFTEAKVTLAAGISIMVSIVFFMIIFVWKLGFAIWQRRRLGVRTYGPMEVLFIMGCCTMIVPTIFSIMLCITDLPFIPTLTLTLTATMLPLSSIWAAEGINHGAVPTFEQHPAKAHDPEAGLKHVEDPVMTPVRPIYDDSVLMSGSTVQTYVVRGSNGLDVNKKLPKSPLT